jgi:heat shock protein 1/8
VCVYEGERSRTDENNLLGKFTISGIERAKRGVPKIDVSFSLDSNGILQVTAKDQTTMAEAHIEIERSGRSSDADIERMVKEAAKYRAEDEERVKRVEAFNDLESLVTETRTVINDLTDAKKAAQLETLVDDVEQWAQDNEETAKIAEIKLKRRQLEQQISKMQPK